MLKKKFFLLNSFYSFLPGIFSIFISIFSIPIFLKILGDSYFGQYLIQNIFLSLGFLFNFGLYRIIIINFDKKKNLKNISQNTYYFYINLLLGFFFTSILMMLFFILGKYHPFKTLDLLLNKYIFFGIILASLYFTFESILRVNGKFKILSAYNFFFNSIAFTLPSFYLLGKKNLTDNYEILNYPEEIFAIVIYIKFIIIFVTYIYLIKSNILNIYNLNINLFNNYKLLIKEIFFATIQSLSFFLNNITDKIFVKITLGNQYLSVYSISQQIAAKSTVLITAISTVFFPKVSKEIRNSRKIKLFKYIIRITIVFTGLINFFSFPFLEIILQFWLGKNFSLTYVILLKIFLFYSFYASLNFVISQYLDSEKLNKNNSLIDISFYFISIIFFLFIFIYKIEKIEFFAYIILIREFLLLLFKYSKFNIYFKDLKNELLISILMTIFFIISIFYSNLHLDLFLISVLLIAILFFNNIFLTKYFSLKFMRIFN
jgi:O-antigen/teichoic acid export membrane protein